MKTILKILDEVNIKFDGLDIKTRRKLVDAVKFFIPYARHLPMYKLGRWDGTVSFCTLGGASYLNLLDRLIPIVYGDGYEIEIEDHRKKINFEFPIIDKDFNSDFQWSRSGHMSDAQPIELRDYQVEIINKCLSNLQSITVAATGSGKTLITATLSRIVEKYGRSIIIVPNKSLVDQTERDYKLLNLDVGVYYGDRKEPGKKHTICTWQSLNILDKKSKEYNDLDVENFITDIQTVIVDECFDGDSKVLTINGYVPIKDIKPGDEVINYSETEKCFKTDVVIKQHKNLTNSLNEKMYKLEFDNGSVIEVTGNHKFLTNNGWIRADSLDENDEILSFSEI